MNNAYHIRRGWFYVINSFSLLINFMAFAFFVICCVPTIVTGVSSIGLDNSELGLLGSIGILFTSGMCIMNILLFKFFKLPDEELMSNKYFIGVVGLFSGQVIIPFLILSVIPNVTTKRTISPKVLVSKTYGTMTFWSGLLAFAGIVISNVLISKTDFLGTYPVLIYVFGAIAIYGLFNILLFWRKSISELKEDNPKLNIIQLIFGFINNIIATIGLIILMLMSILSFIESIARLFSGNEKGFAAMLTFMVKLLNIAYTFAKMIMVIKFASETIKTIWSNDAVEMKAYDKLNEYEQKNSKNINA